MRLYLIDIHASMCYALKRYAVSLQNVFLFDCAHSYFTDIEENSYAPTKEGICLEPTLCYHRPVCIKRLRGIRKWLCLHRNFCVFKGHQRSRGRELLW